MGWPKETCSGRPPEPGHEGGPAPAPVGADGQHGDHWVLPADQRAARARPVRRTYFHERCGTKTTMPQAVAETYAAEPAYYGRTFCCACGAYFPVGPGGDFRWVGEDGAVLPDKVGA